MFYKGLNFFLIISIIFLFSNNDLICQSKKKKEELDFHKLYIPNENHDNLKKFEGTWKFNFEIITTDGPLAGSGVTGNEIINEGRHLKISQEMNISGIPTKILTLIGYDNLKNKYYMFSIDNSRTDPLYCEGTYDSKLNQITFFGTEYDPINEKDNKYKIQITLERENKYTYKFYSIGENKENLITVFVYIRL